MSDHPHYPEAVITADRLQSMLGQDDLRIVEVDIDPGCYHSGHVPGALCWDWEAQLRDKVTNEILTREAFEKLMSEAGISRETKVVLYGDNNNWFACWAFWLMKIYGHADVKMLDGGSRKWIADGRPVSLEMPTVEPTRYVAEEGDLSVKATTEAIFESFFNPETHRLLDVRSSAEYVGRISSPGVGMDSKCAISGHIPTAINVPWNLNCNADGTFKSPEELRTVYASFDVQPEMQVVTYCAIGERASLSWFVLKHLLGYPVVLNYDRSMSHWSRIANAPIVQGDAA